MTDQAIQIAIDGPVAAGKSSVAKKLAERLGFLYVDTGAMYRAVTLMAERAGIACEDEEQLVKMIGTLKMEIRLPTEAEKDGRLSTVLVNGEDVSWAIRKGVVNRDVPVVAAQPKVRAALVPIQRQIAQGKQVVMEGRDITYAVLPGAQIRIYLDAKESVRIERYYQSRLAQNKQMSLKEVETWLKMRDMTDKTRESSPLKIVPGVWYLDCSALHIDEVVDLIQRKVEALQVAGEVS